MVDIRRATLQEIEQKVCDIAADQLNISRNKIGPASRLIQDLHCDSLDLVELIGSCSRTLTTAVSTC